MLDYRTLSVMVIALLLGIGLSLRADAFTGEEYASQAKVSMQQARDIAQEQVPGGKIVKEELEKESGGSGLRYSFDIEKNGVTHEVGVDAKTGNVLESSLEGQEGKEGESKEKD